MYTQALLSLSGLYLWIIYPKWINKTTQACGDLGVTHVSVVTLHVWQQRASWMWLSGTDSRGKPVRLFIQQIVSARFSLKSCVFLFVFFFPHAGVCLLLQLKTFQQYFKIQVWKGLKLARWCCLKHFHTMLFSLGQSSQTYSRLHEETRELFFLLSIQTSPLFFSSKAAQGLNCVWLYPNGQSRPTCVLTLNICLSAMSC